MTIVRKLLLATGSAAALAGAAQGQVYNSGNLGNIGTGIANWATANALPFTIPAGTYTNYAVVVDWNGNGNSNQFSSEARAFLGLGAANGGAAGSAPISPVASQTIARTTAAATNSAGSGANRGMFWTGTIATSAARTFTAPTNAFVSAGQTWTTGTLNAGWNNVRVVMNYTTFSTVAPTTVNTNAPAPSMPTIAQLSSLGAYTDLGTLTPGRISNTVTTTAAQPRSFFRFVLPTNVSASNAGTLLDLDTTGTSDTGIAIYRVNAGTGQLERISTAASAYTYNNALATAPDVRYAADDTGDAANAMLTYGSTNPLAFAGSAQRSYGITTGTTTPGSFAYNGNNGDLFAGEYVAVVGGFSGLVDTTTTSPTVTTISSATTLTEVTPGNFTFGLVNSTLTTPAGNTFFGAPSTVTTTFNIAFAPTPGAAALLGLGGLMAARRRRA